MRLTWHIIWKDVRGLRWPLLLWIALFLLQAGAGVVASGAEATSEFIDNFKIGNSLLVGIQFAVSFLLVVQCVQADGLAGTRMFWLTRPISSERLFRTKVLEVLLLFMLLPALLLLPWWLYNGFTARDVLWTAVELAGWQLLVVGPAFLIASLTDDLGRAILAGMVLVALLMAGLVLVPGNIGAGVKLAADVIGAEFSKRNSLLFTQLWLGGALLIAGSAIVAAHQFRSRHSVRSLVLAGGVLGLALLGRLSPWDQTWVFTVLNDTPDPVVREGDAALANLQVKALPSEVSRETDGWLVNKGQRLVFQGFELEGVSDEFSIWGARVRQSWHWPGEISPVERTIPLGATWKWGLPMMKALGLSMPGEDAETTRWLEQKNAERAARGWRPLPLGVYTQDYVSQARVILMGNMNIHRSLVARMEQQPPVVAAAIEVDFAKPRMIFELPLRSEARWAGGSQALQIGRVLSRNRNQVVLQVVHASPGISANGLWLAQAMASGRASRFPEGFLAVNRHANTFASAGASGDMASTGRVVVAGVQLQWRQFYAGTSRVIREGEWVPRDPDWLEHTTLVLMDTNPPRIRIKRELKTERYELKPYGSWLSSF